MKNGICPKCGSNEVLSNLRGSGGQVYPPYVDIMEPEPVNYAALNDGRGKGYIGD